jgi:hypothetical protein
MNTNKSGFQPSATEDTNIIGTIGSAVFFVLTIIAVAAYVYFQMGI